MSQSPLVALHGALQEAEQFIAGFEDDESQQPLVTPLLAKLRTLIALPPPPPAKSFDELPLASCAPSLEERARWINVLDPLLRYAGSPGDWGRESKLGQLTMRLMQVRAELADASTLPKEGGAA
jgi:hypothetical protein